MTFEAAVVSCLRGYARFDGRAGRAEYWWFQCFLLLMVVVAMILGSLHEAIGGVFLVIVAFGLFVPNLSVTVRRMHDSGWSGLWLLGLLVPLGGMALFILMVWPGDAKANRFGPPAKDMRAPIVRFDQTDASFDNTRIPRVTQHRDDL